MTTLLKRNTIDGVPDYKPMLYPEAYEFYEKHESMHWLKDEVDLNQDVVDWDSKLKEGDRFVITNFLRIFTQADILVGAGYDTLLRAFKPTEVCMMLRGFAARENIHVDAYSYFTDTIGKKEDFYTEWRDIEEAKSKMTFVQNARVKTLSEYVEAIRKEHPFYTDKDVFAQADLTFRRDLARMLGIYGGLVEGVSLFSSFALLFNYSRQGVMNGLATIVEWSILDENVHSEANAWLFKQLIKENLDIWTDELKRDLYSAARETVFLEDLFIKFAFGNTEIKGLTQEELKIYVRYMADRRLMALGLKPNFGITVNPLPWMESILTGSKQTNFFDARVTDYAKASTGGSWGEVRHILANATKE